MGQPNPWKTLTRPNRTKSMGQLNPWTTLGWCTCSTSAATRTRTAVGTRCAPTVESATRLSSVAVYMDVRIIFLLRDVRLRGIVLSLFVSPSRRRRSHVAGTLNSDCSTREIIVTMSVRPSVCLSHRPVLCVKTAERRISQTTPHESPGNPGLPMPRIVVKFARDHLFTRQRVCYPTVKCRYVGMSGYFFYRATTDRAV